ncbi:MAG: peptidase T [Spirochaetota bacterium]
MSINNDNDRIKQELLERFIRYVKIDTTSYKHREKIPSTPGQWTLLKDLVTELKDFRITAVDLDENGYLIGRIPSNITSEKNPPAIGFMAHVDTSSDVSGTNVLPRIHRDYDGKPIYLKGDQVLDPAGTPSLLNYRGDTIITSDGSTLLGADDKAGVAEIMTAAAWLQKNPHFPHGTVEIIFTPDEETGRGLDYFPVKKLESRYCYTLDGDGEGTVEAECFNGYTVFVTIKGVVIHTGIARGKLRNAVTMAGAFVNMLPRNESPEATDLRYGFYCPVEIRGELGEAKIEIYLRDYEKEEIERRIEVLKRIALAVEGMFPGGKVELEVRKMYSNMRDYINKNNKVLDLLDLAIRRAGAEPVKKSIRGGTEGARLSEMGIPAPNIFNGGSNFHSTLEWASLSAMGKACKTIINLISLWAEKGIES